MSPKLSHIAIFLTFISLASQLKLVSKKDTISYHPGFSFNKLLQHLSERAPDIHEVKNSNTPTTLLNVHNLNVFLDDLSFSRQKTSQRSGDQDALCKFGRCGCSGKRCRSDDNNVGSDQVQEILNELEKELSKVGSLRCSEDKCKDEEENEEEDDSCGCDSRSGNDRCGCGPRSGDARCGCGPRRGDRNDNNNNDHNDVDDKSLRCQSDRCGRGRTRSDKDLKSKLEKYGKKYKINDELDAIVLDLSNFNGFLGKLNDNRGKDAFIKRDLDLDYYFNVGDGNRKENSNYLETLRVDDDGQKDDSNQLRRIKDSLFFQSKVKDVNGLYDVNQQGLNNALNFVKNNRGDKDLSSFTNEQKYQLQKLKLQYLKFGATSDENDLKDQIKRVTLGEDIKSDNGKIQAYMPKWLHRAVTSFNYDDDRLRTKKQMFPLTFNQKLKLSKKSNKPKKPRVARKLGDLYGAPFELHIEGLGQLSPSQVN
ncbi:unnamed protein product [Diatraea saccharalis]|uniref:Uncharacterized protein n=1 Tax=Diatraea saccharalis TaxID=40085 RepID=A0A9N9WHL6_9NEOP|nr:unnamed protein product [Diatraea saccharalis]